MASDVAAPEKGFNAGHKLGKLKGFDEIIIGSGLKTPDNVIEAVESREHKDRYGLKSRIGAQFLAAFQAVNIRKHKIQGDHIGNHGI